MAVLLNRHINTLPLSAKSFPLPAAPPGLPVLLHYNTGGALQGGTVPVVCGGYFRLSRKVYSNKCHIYSSATGKWSESPGRLSERKAYLASSMHPDLGMVITGGYLGGKRTISTVESTTDGVHFSKELPALPVTMNSHCQLTVDANTIMVIAGYRDEDPNPYLDVVLRLDVRAKRWIWLPKMPVARYGSACGVVSERGQPDRVVVTGGWSKHERNENRVDVFRISTQTWEAGRPLPKSLYYHAAIPFRDTFFILGGYHAKEKTTKVYRYDLDFDMFILMPYQLSFPSRGFAAFPVSRKAFNGQ